MPMRALVVLNPAATRARPDRVRQALDNGFGNGTRDYRLIETFASGDTGEIDRELAHALGEGCDFAIAAGGDGTVSLLAGRIAHQPAGSSLVLGVIPLGTANVLAHELGIPIDLDKAVTIAVERRRIVTLDAIQLGARRFLTQVGIGLDARMIADTGPSRGRTAYLTALVRRAFGHRAHHFRFEVDGIEIHGRAWQVVLANAATLGTAPLRWGPEIDPSDGILDLCTVSTRTLGGALDLAWRLLSGGTRQHAGVRYYKVSREVTITTRRPLAVQGDGDLVAETPVTLRVAPGSVRVVVPAPDSPAAEEVRPAQAEVSAPIVIPARPRGLLQRMAALDSAVFLAVNRLPQRPLVDWLLIRASRLMDHGEGWVLVALATAWARPAGKVRLVLVVVAALWLTMLTVNYPVKALFRRGRPFLLHLESRVIGRRPSDWSFPSGHTAAAFAGATLLSAELPVLAPLFIAYASVVGFARVYFGVHYLSDVGIGAAIGIALALVYRGLLEVVVPG